MGTPFGASFFCAVPHVRCGTGFGYGHKKTAGIGGFFVSIRLRMGGIMKVYSGCGCCLIKSTY